MTFRIREFPASDTPASSGAWELALERVEGDPASLRRSLLKLTFLDGELLDRMLSELPALVLHGVDLERARAGAEMLESAGGRAAVYPTGRWRKTELTFSDAYPEHRRATELIGERLAAAGATPAEQTALEAALREAIANASIHGNEQDPDKEIEVEFLQAGGWVEIAVSDQGTGFDFDSQLDELSHDIAELAAERLSQGRIGGLGLAMIQRCTDRMRFEPPGNRIRFGKCLSCSGAATHPHHGFVTDPRP